MSTSTATPTKPTASASTASPASATKAKTHETATPLNKLIETPEFAWFSAHAIALFAYLVGFIFRKGGISTFFSKLFFLAELLSFGLILYQKHGTKVVPRALAVDDNAHYLLLSVVLFFASKRAFTATPFAIYSLFHVLTYARGYLLPSLGYAAESPYNKQIENFIKTRNGQFTTLAAQIELGVLVLLFLSLFTFRKGNFIVFIAYAAFYRFRYAVSAYNRNVTHKAEIQIDHIAGNFPAVKDIWLKAKGVIAQIPGPSRVN